MLSHSFSKLTFVFLLLLPSLSFASGGYDNGTPAGEGNIDIELTLNPGDVIDKGQSYIVWGYGLTDQLDFHGYVSHEAGGTDQIYYGLMYNFFHNEIMDLSTAVGIRQREENTDIFGPQILYTIRITQGFDIIGSIVNVYNSNLGYNRGQTFDIAFRLPIPELLTPNFITDAKLALGAFQGLSGNIYPTYSVDLRF